MIDYDQRSWGGLGLICKLEGSVYGRVVWPTIFSSLVIIIVKGLDYFYDLQPMSIFNHPNVYQTYTIVLGFVVVFRCNLAYGRFWEGRSMLELMSSKWSDAVLQCVVFDNISKKPEADRRAFRSRIVSLFSLLHGTTIATLQDNEYPIEVVEGLDPVAVASRLNNTCVDDQVFLVFSWIQHTLIGRQHSGGLAVPPPVCTRLFQEMSNGMLGFNNANKIHNTPFPFPYAQLITLALLVLTCTSGFMVTVIVNSLPWCLMLNILCVAGYHAINEVAIQLEDPFGADANDLPLMEYQQAYNMRIRPLLHLDEGIFRVPALEVSYAAMATTYDTKGDAPLSPSSITRPGGYLDTVMNKGGVDHAYNGSHPEHSTSVDEDEDEESDDGDERLPLQVAWVTQHLRPKDE